MTRKTVAGYVRVSTDEQSVDLQERAILEKYPGAVIYRDEGVSGSTRKRPGLDAMLAAVFADKHSAVVVWKLDRLGRSMVHVVGTMEAILGHGVAFASVTENIDTSTPMGKAFVGLIAVFAELERDVIRERVQAGMDSARARGVRVGRPPKGLPVDAARELLDKGHSLRKVATMLRVSPSTLARRLRQKGGVTGVPVSAE